VAIYLVTGKLGCGKTKLAVMKAREALAAGRRVASNVDLFLDKLLPRHRRAAYVRLPDKPCADDLVAAGHGNPDSYDEDKKRFVSAGIPIPRFFAIRRSACEIFDTTQKIEKSNPPPLHHLDRVCELAHCAYHKTIHV